MTVASGSADVPRSGSGTARRAYRSAAPPWASGIVTGVETAVLSAGLVFAFVFAAVASAPSVDGSISADWSGAWDVGTSVWLLAHGVPAAVGDVSVTLIPLGLTLTVGVIAASVARRVAVPAHASVACAALTYGAIAAIVSASDHGGAAAGWRAGIVGGLACGIGASIGLLRAHGFHFWKGMRPPSFVGLGLRLGLGAWALCLLAGTALAISWQVSAADRMAGAVDDLAPDLAGGLTLAVGETAYIPTVSIWALSWLSGRGFALGAGSHYSPGEVIEGPVPDIPLLAALPESTGGLVFLAPLVLVAVGALARLAARRWLPKGGAGMRAQGLAVVVTAAATWGSVALASGSAGGGVLVKAGPEPLPVGLTVGALVGIGLLLASVWLEASPHLAARDRTTQARRAAAPPPAASPEPPPRIPENRDPLRLW